MNLLGSPYYTAVPCSHWTQLSKRYYLKKNVLASISPNILMLYCHKTRHILGNCSIKPPRPRSYPTKAKDFTKPGTFSVAAAASDNSTTPYFQISDLQSLLNQLTSSSSSALAVTPSNRWLLHSACCNHMTSNYSLMNTSSPAKSLPPIYPANGNCMNITHIGPGSAYGTDDWDGSQSALVQRSRPHTSQQNRSAERKYHHILDSVRAFLRSTSCPRNFGVKQLLHQSIRSTVLLLLFFKTSLDSKDYMVLLPTTLTLKSLVVHALFSYILMNTLNLNHMPVSVVSLAMAPNIKLAQSVPTSANSNQSSVSDYGPKPTPDTPPRRSTRASTDPLWQKAMNDELQALDKIHTWDYVDLPPGKRLIGCKWIYKIKTHSDDTIEHYKARFVAKGYLQEYIIDYEETFAHMARMTSIRSLLAVSAAKQWPFLQMDVKNAFLNGTLSEEVYMQPPPDTSPPPHEVCLLRRALYGLKQAPRTWFAIFSSTITQLGFSSSPHDTALFTRHTPQGIVLLLLYVDDMIITGNDPQAISDLQHYLSQYFEMKDLGSLNYFIGLEVSRRSYGFDTIRSQCSSNPYDGVPLEDGTLGHRLPFSFQSSLILSGYSYANWVGDPTNQRSTTGYCFYLGDSLISWRSKKQSVVSRSSTESEYCALADATTELLWFRWLLADMGVPQQGPTLLHCDNRSVIQIAHNDVFHERTKHIENGCHFIRHHLLSNTLLLQPVSTTGQPADIFTKALPSTCFNQLLTKLKLTDTLPP
ncbi:putative mitochondrial protein [Cucumis melo var. makuwa]|uniref:Putative mitochondrial protein n=1 Tax=Cucumis melo var. makuwa TaxID=1194695 RepID=A0A5D3DTM1_CUCMM|nr:putative mitochondrial protein [Cucumis melo var. makuwa]